MNAAVDQFRNVEHLRVLPHATDAEQAVLAGLMIDNAAIAKVQDWLSVDDFYRADHRLIYAGILALAEKREPFDALTVGDWIDAQGQSDMVDGGAYLIDLYRGTASAANIVAYAEIVREKGAQRALIALGNEIADAAHRRESREVVAEAQRSIIALSDNRRIGGAKGMQEIGRSWFAEMQRRYEDKGGLLGLPTPWGKFNALTSGLQAGQLVIVAGRPSMGKSAWAVNVATANALSGKRVLFLNLEMTDVSIYNRAVAAIGDVPLEWLRSPKGPDDETENKNWGRVESAVSTLSRADLLIDDSPGLRREQIIARARREHMRKPLDMLIVDHLHLIPLPGKTRETVEIGEITRDLKALAKEFGIPVILLSQLNRSVDGRAGSKRPVMSDLRESGNIEQDADLIVFLYRDDYYAAREERASDYPGLVEIIVAKQREGETGKVWTHDKLAYGRIDDHDGEVVMRVSEPKRNTRGMRGMDRSAGADA